MEFKLIEGFNSRYSVSPEGKVYSMIVKGTGVSNTPVKELTITDNKGYKRVSLRVAKWDDPIQAKYVHRLVAEAFLDNPMGYSDVNHKDGDKANNNVSNLEWCSRLDNIRHAWDTGLSTCEMQKGKGMTEYTGTCKRTGVVLVKVLGKEKLQELGYSPSCVIRVCTGKRKYHKNMIWTKLKSPEKLDNSNN